MYETWWMGAAAAAIGSAGAGVGENLVRLSYSSLHSLPEPHPPLYKRPLWVIGWLMTTVLTSVCAVVGLALAPMQLLMPIGGLHILFGVAVAHLLNRETMGSGDLLGAFFVCLGVAVVLIGVEKESLAVSFESLNGIIFRAHTIIFFAMLLGSGAMLFSCTEHIEHGKERSRLSRIKSRVRPIAAPALSGLLSANANLMLKISLSLFSDDHWSVSDRSPFWIATGLAISCGIGQVVTLNRALECSPAVVVVPTSNAVLISVGSLAGLLFSSNATLQSTLILFVGVILVLNGIIFLSLRDTHNPDKVCECSPITEEMVNDTHNVSFNSVDTSRSFGGYCENISFNIVDNRHEMKKAVGRITRKLSRTGPPHKRHQFDDELCPNDSMFEVGSDLVSPSVSPLPSLISPKERSLRSRFGEPQFLSIERGSEGRIPVYPAHPPSLS